MATTTTNLEWLKTIADGSGSRLTKEHITREPWSIDHRGEQWSLAADGRVLVMVRGANGFAPMSERGREHIASTLAKIDAMAPSATVTLSKLQDWCRGCNLYGPCEECNGSGKSTCPACGTHDVQCMECDGVGTEPQESIDGIIGETRLNKCLLWHVAQHLSGDQLSVASNSDLVVLRSDGLFAAISGLKPGDPIDDVFDGLETQAGVIGGADG